MFESIANFFKKFSKENTGTNKARDSKDTAKERLHLVLMQDRANVSADFLELMKQEIIDVIKKYIDVDESQIDVKLTNKPNGDGTVGAPALYANIPIVSIKDETRKINVNKEIQAEVVSNNEKVENIAKQEEQPLQANKAEDNNENINNEKNSDENSDNNKENGQDENNSNKKDKEESDINEQKATEESSTDIKKQDNQEKEKEDSQEEQEKNKEQATKN